VPNFLNDFDILWLIWVYQKCTPKSIGLYCHNFPYQNKS
jgi:hypothetical protein